MNYKCDLSNMMFNGNFKIENSTTYIQSNFKNHIAICLKKKASLFRETFLFFKIKKFFITYCVDTDRQLQTKRL